MFNLNSLFIVCLAKAIRTFGFGFVSVILALFLLDKGFSPAAVGAIFSATLIEDAIITAFVSTLALRLGLRRVLLASCLLVIACGLALASSSNPWIIVVASVFGIVSPAGYEGGPFSPVEQTIISQCERSDNLTRAFSWYNLTGFAGAALGALFAGTAITLAHSHHFQAVYPAMFLLYALGGVILLALYLALNIAPLTLEKDFARAAHLSKNKKQKSAQGNQAFVLHRSRANVFKLAALQSLDAFGGGFVAQSLIAYWFYLRFQAGPEFTGPIFFWANVLAAVSFTVAPYVVKRLGLLKTMVFTHLPCSLTLCLIPFMPDAAWAGFIILARSLFSSMDIPVRQAYSMLIVEVDERPAAAGIISAARALSQGMSPLFAGFGLGGAGAMLGLPFICAGAAKSVYDLGLYFTFANVPLMAEDKAPERLPEFQLK